MRGNETVNVKCSAQAWGLVVAGRQSIAQLTPGHSSWDRGEMCTCDRPEFQVLGSLFQLFSTVVSLLCLPASWTFFSQSYAHLTQIKRLVLPQAKDSCSLQDGAFSFTIRYL